MIKMVTGQVKEPPGTANTDQSVHLVQFLLYYPVETPSPITHYVEKMKLRNNKESL